MEKTRRKYLSGLNFDVLTIKIVVLKTFSSPLCRFDNFADHANKGKVTLQSPPYPYISASVWSFRQRPGLIPSLAVNARIKLLSET